MPRAKLMSLCNGAELPVLGLGTAKCDNVYEAVTDAVQAGYTHFDTAYAYHNEAELGRALRDQIRLGRVTREHLWITTKVWNSYHRVEQVEECFQRSAMALGMDYVDLYLMHWPIAFREGHEGRPEDGIPQTTDVDFLDCWRGMEELYMEGRVRNIGVSNFNSEQLDRLLANCTIKPLVNQVEANIYLNQEKLRAFCAQRGITLTAYSPLGSPGNKRNPDSPNLLEDLTVCQLASEHKKTPAQVLLRFLIQRGIAVIPKSSNNRHITENIEVFDFHLDPKEMALLMSLDRGLRQFKVENLKTHKFYPFGIEY